MDKYVLIKQSFYTDYDIIRFDNITLEKIIDLLKNIDYDIESEVLDLLDKLYDSIFDTKIKEIVLIMKSFVINENDYNIVKLINGLEVIKESLSKKEKLYQKYVSYIDNLH